MNRHVIAMVAGFALDAALGDPHGWPHPVKLIGKQIELEEKLVRTYLLPEAAEAGDAWPLDRAQTERLGGAARGWFYGAGATEAGLKAGLTAALVFPVLMALGVLWLKKGKKQ